MLNRRINPIVVLLSVVILALSLTGCNRTTGQEQQDAAEVTVIDTSGRTITISQPVERVAVLNLSAAEIMRALGVEDRIVGMHQSMQGNPYWPEMQDRPVVASYSEINYSYNFYCPAYFV